MNHHFHHGLLLKEWEDTKACTHVAALLFWVEMVIKIHNSKKVTDKQAYWLSPSNSDTFLQPEMLFNIDFRCPQFKKKRIEKLISSSSTLPNDELSSPPMKKKSPITKATSSEMDSFFEKINEIR